MNEEFHILMDRLDDLFSQLSKHNWEVPLWIRHELRLIEAQYKRINKALGVRAAENDLPPGTVVEYQDCRWTVVWSDKEWASIRSCGGSEVIIVRRSNVRPADTEEEK